VPPEIIYFMGKLPEKFPEYSIMYKTISKQVKLLENTKENIDEKEEITLKIQNYKRELNKIKEKFPDNYFDEFDSSCS
jgi:predicted patatin/cPLA2 family phospholipase